MEILNYPRLNQIDAVHYLVREYFPQEIPLAYRAAGAFYFVEELFGTPCPNQLPPGPNPTISEELLIECVSDYAWRPLAEGEWLLVNLYDDEPEALLHPAEA